jgi:hypothetical protein
MLTLGDHSIDVIALLRDSLSWKVNIGVTLSPFCMLEPFEFSSSASSKKAPRTSI